MTLDDLIERAYRHASRVLIKERQTMLAPAFIMVGPDGAITAFAPQWVTAADKEASAIYARALMRETGCVQYSFLSEAWVATQPKGWRPGDDEGPSPSDRPDRAEIVFALASDKHHQVCRDWAIVRDRKGRIVKLEPRGDIGGDILGRFSNLLATTQ